MEVEKLSQQQSQKGLFLKNRPCSISDENQTFKKINKRTESFFDFVECQEMRKAQESKSIIQRDIHSNVELHIPSFNKNYDDMNGRLSPSLSREQNSLIELKNLESSRTRQQSQNTKQLLTPVNKIQKSDTILTASDQSEYIEEFKIKPRQRRACAKDLNLNLIGNAKENNHQKKSNKSVMIIAKYFQNKLLQYFQIIINIKDYFQFQLDFLFDRNCSEDIRNSLQEKVDITLFFRNSLPKLKRFISKKTISGKSKLLNSEIRNSIGDKSDYNFLEQFSQNKQLICKQLIVLRLSKLSKLIGLNKIPIFDPENIFKIIFNSITVTYSCFYLFIVSLQLFFEASFGSQIDKDIHFIAELVWVIEMIIQMNTSMYHHNNFTKDRVVIFQIYIKEYFLFEILPLIFDQFKSDQKVLNLLYKLPLLLKIKGISIILKNLEFYILQILNNHHILFFFKLMFQIILSIHVFACLWGGINSILVYNEEQNTLWQQQYNELNEKWLSKYIQALDWACKTMFSSEYHIQPQSNSEIIFTCICSLVSFLIFGYFLQSIGVLLEEISKENKQYKKDLNAINKFMKRKKIEISLVRRVNIQLKKFYEQNMRVKSTEESTALLKLNKYITKELVIQSNMKILKQFSFFKEKFSNLTLIEACHIMKENFYSPNQEIFCEGKENSSSCLYLILEGQVSIEYSTERNSEDQMHSIVCNEGECFGYHGFLIERENLSKAKSIGFSTIITIERSEFLNFLITSKDKKDLQQFHELKDKAIFFRDFRGFKQKCKSCGSRFHETTDCCMAHFEKDLLYVQRASNREMHQERNFSQRRKNRQESIIIYQQTQTEHEKTNDSNFVFGLKDIEESKERFSEFIKPNSVKEIDFLKKTNKSQGFITWIQKNSQSSAKIDLPSSKKSIKTVCPSLQLQQFDESPSFRYRFTLKGGEEAKKSFLSLYENGTEKSKKEETDISEQKGENNALMKKNALKRCSIDIDLKSDIGGIKGNIEHYKILTNIHEIIIKIQTQLQKMNKIPFSKKDSVSLNDIDFEQRIKNDPQFLCNMSSVEQVVLRRQQNRKTILRNQTKEIKKNSIFAECSKNLSTKQNLKSRVSASQIWLKDMQQNTQLSEFSEEDVFEKDMDKMFDFKDYFQNKNYPIILQNLATLQVKNRLKSKNENKQRKLKIINTQRKSKAKEQ